MRILPHPPVTGREEKQQTRLPVEQETTGAAPVAAAMFSSGTRKKEIRPAWDREILGAVPRCPTNSPWKTNRTSAPERSRKPNVPLGGIGGRTCVFRQFSPRNSRHQNAGLLNRTLQVGVLPGRPVSNRFRSSTTVVRPPVKRRVAGANPASGASFEVRNQPINQTRRNPMPSIKTQIIDCRHSRLLWKQTFEVRSKRKPGDP